MPWHECDNININGARGLAKEQGGSDIDARSEWKSSRIATIQKHRHAVRAACSRFFCYTHLIIIIYLNKHIYIYPSK